MPAFWINLHELSFPHPSYSEPDGLLAVGGDLRPERLILAYQNGIFPWYEGRSGIAWFSPDPRCVLFPKDIKIQRSLRSTFNQNKFDITVDTCFRKVMETCADTPRRGQYGSWLNQNFIDSYTHMHELGIAHSVEVWQSGELVGGLYGLALGKIFCGESMFARVPNASKFGFISLVRALERWGFWLIDCQVETEHLKSLGASTIRRTDFLEILMKNRYEQGHIGKWQWQNDGLVCQSIQTNNKEK